MALVDVPDGRVDAEAARAGARRRGRARSPGCSRRLLIAAVEIARDLAILGSVLLDVRVEEIEIDPSDARAPRAERELAAGELQAHLHRLSARVADELQRQALRGSFSASTAICSPVARQALGEVPHAVDRGRRRRAEGRDRWRTSGDRRRGCPAPRCRCAATRGCRTRRRSTRWAAPRSGRSGRAALAERPRDRRRSGRGLARAEHGSPCRLRALPGPRATPGAGGAWDCASSSPTPAGRALRTSWSPARPTTTSSCARAARGRRARAAGSPPRRRRPISACVRQGRAARRERAWAGASAALPTRAFREPPSTASSQASW